MATKEQVFAQHPCFGAARNRGRIHLPVCPVCNISCNFCVRSLNEDEDRPGVTAQVISPEEAVEVVRRGVELCPEISVAGIAGPGDTLATDHALETFRRIKKEFPGLLRCMSTNGLLLDERAEELLEVGIDTLTVTVNAVDPEIQKEICANVWYHGRRYTGIEGAQLLIENQLRGLERMAGAGVALKVNTVLIPGINDDHIETVARTVGRLGVLRYNIIPLGLWSGVKKNKTADHIISLISYIGISIPNFWVGILLILLFSLTLGWLPASGMHSLNDNSFLDLVRHALMPVFITGMSHVAVFTRYIRSNTIREMGEEYVLTAISKGTPRIRIIFGHVLKNCLLPIITLVGMNLVSLVTGSFIVESVFGWPGLGKLGVSSVTSRDYPVIMGITMLACAVLIVGNFLADILYTVVDPRIQSAIKEARR